MCFRVVVVFSSFMVGVEWVCRVCGFGMFSNWYCGGRFLKLCWLVVFEEYFWGEGCECGGMKGKREEFLDFRVE